jgi:hypothetical protein
LIAQITRRVLDDAAVVDHAYYASYCVGTSAQTKQPDLSSFAIVLGNVLVYLNASVAYIVRSRTIEKVGEEGASQTDTVEVFGSKLSCWVFEFSRSSWVLHVDASHFCQDLDVGSGISFWTTPSAVAED